MFYLTTYSTHFIYMASDIIILSIKEDILCLLNLSINYNKELVYLTTHSTHFIYGYMASDIIHKNVSRIQTICFI